MDNISVRQIANEITALAKESFEKSWDGNSKQANNAYRQCEKIKEKIAEDKNFLQELVKYTLSSDDIHARRQGMIIGLSTGIEKVSALAELKREIDLQNSEDITLKRIAFEAQMLKKSIDDNGYIKMFTNQSKYAIYDKDWFC